MTKAKIEMKKNRGEFVVAFLGAVFDFGKGFVQAFAREPWHYKDLRIGGFDPEKIYRNTNNLKQRGILKSSGGGKFEFTKQGLAWAQYAAKRYFPEHKSWDGRWRVVIFDIPQELHTSRLKLGRKLKNLGFYTLQKSVFVFPYPCEEELGYICRDLKVSDYVDVIIAENPGTKEEELRKIYNL